MPRRYIILILLSITLIAVSCVNLKHSNPVDPEYKGDTNEDTTEESVLPSNTDPEVRDKTTNLFLPVNKYSW